MKKITVISPANIAFIKYWGHKGEPLYLPYNSSISMTLNGCLTTTTVHISTDISEDRIEIKTIGDEYVQLDDSSIKGKKAYEQIDRIRALAGSQKKVQIRTQNSFPSDAGIASSASGFSALTTALLLAYDKQDLVTDKKELSRQVRLAGSGSATRSVYGGFVELLAGDTSDESYAIQLADEHSWDLVDVIAIINSDKKDVSSSEGHIRAETNPYFKTRLEEMKQRIELTKEAIQEKDLEKLGLAMEADTLSMHAVMMTSTPPALYFAPGTIAVMKEIVGIRKKGIPCYFSIDAGANVHVITEKKHANSITQLLHQNSFVESTLYNEPSGGTHELSDHLF